MIGFRTARSSDETRFWLYDQTVYRERPGELPNEIWLSGEWRAIVPSEEDYHHMRPIGFATAARLVDDPAAEIPSWLDPDDDLRFGPSIEPQFDITDLINAHGSYEDGEPLDLGRHGTLDPSAGDLFSTSD
jgi:hypothetical protein